MANPLTQDLDHILAHTQGLWEELRGRRIFITGGTGFFGCWLLESFLWANEKLGLNAKATVLTRDPEAFRGKARHLADDPSVELLRGDVRDFEFPEGEYSHVIHAATDTAGSAYDENPLLILETIIEGTRHTLDFARECGAGKFLLTSSGAVYGKQPPEITHVPEDYAGAPEPADVRSVYGEGKRAAELLCALYARQYCIETKIARCFAFVGPYLPLDAHFAIGNFVRDAAMNRPIIVHGDGTPYRSYLYAADLAIWLWTILFRGESARPYNVGSEEEISIAELARTVAEICGSGIEVRIVRQPQAGVPAHRYVPSTTRASGELGLRQVVRLDEAITQTKLSFSRSRQH